MRIKWMTGAAAAAALAFVGASANADVFVYGEVYKYKYIEVDLDIEIDKYVDLNTYQWIAVDAVAETDVVKNQRNTLNFVEDENGDSLATIDGSAASASGVVLINQAPGLVNNQGNEVSVVQATSQHDQSFVPKPGVTAKAVPGGETPTPVTVSNWVDTAEVDEWVTVDGGVFVHAQASVMQVNAPDFNGSSEGPSTLATLQSAANVYVNVDPAINTNEITGGSFDGAAGIIGVNQAAGHLNNQNNAIAVALGDESVYALGESDLGQFNIYNYVDVIDQVRTDTISGSLNGATGIVTVNQSAGSMNNQANVVSVAVGSSLLP